MPILRIDLDPGLMRFLILRRGVPDNCGGVAIKPLRAVAAFDFEKSRVAAAIEVAFGARSRGGTGVAVSGLCGLGIFASPFHTFHHGSNVGAARPAGAQGQAGQQKQSVRTHSILQRIWQLDNM